MPDNIRYSMLSNLKQKNLVYRKANPEVNILQASSQTTSRGSLLPSHECSAFILCFQPPKMSGSGKAVSDR